VTIAADRHGLVPILGMDPNVGVGGLTLGGGMGWFCGRYGATVDNLVEIEMVAADGNLLRASAAENPDLFWALRGGGGNFGVATQFTYQLQPQDKVLAGTIAFQGDVTKFLRFYRDFLGSGPDALDTAGTIICGENTTLMITVCWSGDLAEGEKVLRSLNTFATPIADSIAVCSFESFVNRDVLGLSKLENMFWRGGALNGLNDHAIAAIASLVDRKPPPGCGIGILHHMHGALCKGDKSATPFLREEGHVLYNLLTLWHGGVSPAEQVDWVKGAYEEMRKVASRQTYVNYLSEQGDAAVRDAYGAHYDKLCKLKRAYDPTNLFHGNRNLRV
jgi:FAD/FMN-containing dehydrogenase